MEQSEKQVLLGKVARLEAKLDAFESWYTDFDSQLKRIGFPEGITTLIEAFNGVELPEEREEEE
ncbi:MAG: hypothetical protein AB7F31_01000 [Parachlamydiales bacterium]